MGEKYGCYDGHRRCEWNKSSIGLIRSTIILHCAHQRGWSTVATKSMKQTTAGALLLDLLEIGNLVNASMTWPEEATND